MFNTSVNAFYFQNEILNVHTPFFHLRIKYCQKVFYMLILNQGRFLNVVKRRNLPFLFFKGKNFIRLNLATVNCFSHYVGWQQEKKLSNRKNISCMIEIYQGEITGFVKQNYCDS